MFGKLSSWAQFQLEGTRPARYAGSWYEGDPERLKAQVEGFLKSASEMDEKSAATLTKSNQPVKQPVLAIVSPHAGLMYSGQTAAFGFKLAARQSVKRIFLLGPSHHVGFKGAAVPLAVTFATPLGNLEVDKKVIEELRAYPGFSTQPEVHKVEHSLELQTPFLAALFPEAKIVPVVIGQLDDEADARLIGEVLKGYVAKGDLVVVSSDFTHYGPRYDYSPFKTDIEDNIRKLDARAFSYLSKGDLEGFLKFQKETGDTICGVYPCAVLCAMLPSGAHGTLLKYATSAQVHPDDKENSVSYLSIAFTGGDWPENPGQVKPAAEVVKLSNAEKQDLLKLARQTMDLFVRKEDVPSPESLGIKITPAMSECFGVFVTIVQKGLPETENLRGCIGSIYPTRPLWKSVQDNAVAAATRDHRFNPVSVSELSGLDLHLNVLTPPRRIESYKEIVIGRDGIILSKYGHQAVFLPKVPVEFGWTLSDTLTQLARKAGLKADDWQEGAKYDIFQSVEF